MAERRSRLRSLGLAVLALVLVAGAVTAGRVVWERSTRTDLEEALHVVPASSLRVGFTDWAGVRRQLRADLGDTPDRDAVEDFVARAYDTDFSAVSSVDESAGALQENFGFSPATVQWEAFAQGRQGAVMVLKVAEGADFDILAKNLGTIGYREPEDDEGVWKGGVDLVSAIDPTITPELQYVALVADRGLVVSSDSSRFAATAAAVASGDGDSFASVDGVAAMADALDEPANAMLWGKDFACADLAMAGADADAQAEGERLVEEVGGVSPLAGLAMGMLSDRTLRVAAHFEDSEDARENLRPRAELAVGKAVGRGGSFADDLELVASGARGSEVLLDFRPREETGFVLSALYDGPVLFATC